MTLLTPRVPDLCHSNIKGYVAGVKAGDIGTTSHIINGQTVVEKGWCGFVPETTVPTHAGGIFFSTYFAFINSESLL